MQISDRGIQFISKFEGMRMRPYRDSAGLWTVGIGHLMLPGESRNDLTLEQVLELFRKDVGSREEFLNECLDGSVPSQEQFDAMLSLMFNIGNNAFDNSTVLDKFLGGDIPGAGNAFLSWNKAGGRVVQGLVNRRKLERNLFLTGQYL